MKSHSAKLAGRAEELQYEIEERAIVYRRQQDDVGRVRTNVAVKRQEAKSLHQQLSDTAYTGPGTQKYGRATGNTP